MNTNIKIRYAVLACVILVGFMFLASELSYRKAMNDSQPIMQKAVDKAYMQGFNDALKLKQQKGILTLQPAII